MEKEMSPDNREIRINVALKEQTHRLVKAYSALRGMTIGEYVNLAIDKMLEQEEGFYVK